MPDAGRLFEYLTCRKDLISLMPSPTVLTDLTGGHLALMVRLEQYADLVTEFIQGRT